MNGGTVQTVTIGEICAADLGKASVDELRVFADVLGIENAHSLKKADLKKAVAEACSGIKANAASVAVDDESGNNPVVEAGDIADPVEPGAIGDLLPDVPAEADSNDLPLTREEIDHAAENAEWDSALKGADEVHGYLAVPIDGGYLLKPATYIGPVRAVRALPWL